ncbi:MAG: cytochrome B [Gammaproteobacteria bacterium]|nr:cytochrome B [Gammaproteobacteria bacterium]NIR98844.1 cytochrome B [Gammaproteobacteria bacterium]NIT63965.1 cytochrome B [Gammaproteobacteria bacterium]NIV19125.1 cytochrome B [Gammaproteobacteria bacterium]NIX10294.1 cytochrome B [Gammaproteobacteria bacterium]
MQTRETIKVWDPLVRIFHWSLVAIFAIAYLTGEEESALHVWSGYVVLGLVLFRLVWGVVGTRHARFTDFVYRPAHVLTYAKAFIAGRAERYIGHNPLGGLMVVALLVCLLATAGTGLLAYGAEGEGPLAGMAASGAVPAARVDKRGAPLHAERHGEEHEGEETWEEVHELFANLTLLLVALHIAGVIASSLMHGENLVRAMVTGRKPAHIDHGHGRGDHRWAHGLDR